MNKRFDIGASILFLVIGIAFVMGSTSLTTSAYGSKVGPNIFPMILGSILILLSASLLISTLRKAAVQKKKEDYQYKTFLLILGVTVLYCLVYESLGFVISTFLFLFTCFQILEKGKLLSSLLVSLAFAVIVYFVFVYGLNGTLPRIPFLQI